MGRHSKISHIYLGQVIDAQGIRTSPKSEGAGSSGGTSHQERSRTQVHSWNDKLLPEVSTKPFCPPQSAASGQPALGLDKALSEGVPRCQNLSGECASASTL